LAVPARAWPGLKQLPEIGGLSVGSQQDYIRLVRFHASDWHTCHLELPCFFQQEVKAF